MRAHGEGGGGGIAGSRWKCNAGCSLPPPAVPHLHLHHQPQVLLLLMNQSMNPHRQHQLHRDGEGIPFLRGFMYLRVAEATTGQRPTHTTCLDHAGHKRLCLTATA